MHNTNIERGSTFQYKPSHPQVRFNAIGFLDEHNRPTINLAADIGYENLVFRPKADGKRARIAITVQATNVSHNDSVAYNFSKKIDINSKRNKSIINSQKAYGYQHKVKVTPGKYKVDFTVKDLNSGKKTTLTSQTSIPDPKGKESKLTNIRILGKNMKTDHPHWQPITTYIVGGQEDSLLFSFKVTNNSANKPMTVNAQLIRFHSDSTVARPISDNNYNSASIQYAGINYHNKTIVQKAKRVLNKPGNVFVQFRFALPKRGNYRLAVHSTQSDKKLSRARDFAVMSPHYPALKTARELAAPLVYLMKDEDYQRMMEVKDPDSLKQAVYHFWFKHIGNKNKARRVLKKYYKRVKEANQQFAAMKEGWKTDPGMTYILFGSPWYVHKHVDQMKWSYTHNQQESDRIFHFHQPKLKSKNYPFKYYILKRDHDYFTVLHQQRQLWLNGLILQRQL